MHSLVASAAQSFTSGGQQTGAEELERALAADELSDPFAVAAFSIIASLAFSELDMPGRALSVLNVAIDGGEAPPLARAALFQQRAMRTFETGGRGADDAAYAIQLLKQASDSEHPQFAVGPGSTSSSAGSYASVIELLQESATLHLDQIAMTLGEDDWRRRARTAPSALYDSGSRRLASTFTKTTQARFDEATGAHLGRFTIGMTDNGDRDIYATMLNLEFAGHPAVAQTRVLLGMHRFIESLAGSNRAFLVREALRLMRHGRDSKRLDSIIKNVRRNGPLAALAEEAHQVAAKAQDANLVALDFRILASGAETLDSSACQKALGYVLGYVNRLSERQSWSTPDIRGIQEDKWQAGLALAVNGGAIDRFVRALLTTAERDKAGYLGDEEAARLLQQATYQVPQPAQLVASWTTLVDPSLCPTLAEAVSRLTGATSEIAPAEVRGVGDVALLVDESMRLATPFPTEHLMTAEGILRRAMEKTQVDAHAGSFSGGGPSEADIAVAILATRWSPNLWEALSDFLFDPVIQRSDTARAFERLSINRPTLPAEFMNRAAGAISRVVTDTRDLFEGDIAINPAALRFAAVYRLLSDTEILTFLLKLSNGSARPRREAAITIGVMARKGEQPSWSIPLALQLSHDADGAVAAQAARSMCLLALTAEVELRNLAVEQVTRLLVMDSAVVPTGALAGLEESGLSSESLLTTVRQISYSHVSAMVRRRAASLLRNLLDRIESSDSGNRSRGNP